MKLYLDNSFLNRPFDDPAISDNKIETDVLFVILRAIKARKVMLINSALVEYENSKNTQHHRRNFVKRVLSFATRFQSVTPVIRTRARYIEQEFSMDALDALHIASAEAAKADSFITCDHSIIKRYTDDKIVVCNPISFINTWKQ